MSQGTMKTTMPASRTYSTTATTGATGNIAIGHADDLILSTYADGYITIPFRSQGQWFIKVLYFSNLQPVGNTEISYTLEVV